MHPDDELPTGDLPSAEDILEWVRDPASRPDVQEHMANNPDYRRLIAEIPEQVNREARRRIEERAQEKYLERMLTGKEGSQEADWLQAERELSEELHHEGYAKHCKAGSNRGKVKVVATSIAS